MKPGPSYFDLSDKTALVTGATGGIGVAMCEALAGAGANLIVSSDDAQACRDLARNIGNGSMRAVDMPADVRSDAELKALHQTALDEFGRVDILICNAGISGPALPMHHTSALLQDQILAVNFGHCFTLTNIVAPVMAEQGGGSIILTSSIAGLRGNARIGLYGVSKAAISQLARNLAVEWGPMGIRANAIAPGLIRTSWADVILSDPSRAERRLQQTPLRRIGEPWEVGATALFLASPASSFMTGQTLVVDGGTLISDGN